METDFEYPHNFKNRIVPGAKVQWIYESDDDIKQFDIFTVTSIENYERQAIRFRVKEYPRTMAFMTDESYYLVTEQGNKFFRIIDPAIIELPEEEIEL